MAKSKKTDKQAQPKKKTTTRRRKADNQTNQPFEQDSKRRIGWYGGAGEPPLMKK
jgi:hypothetical protein